MAGYRAPHATPNDQEDHTERCEHDAREAFGTLTQSLVEPTAKAQSELREDECLKRDQHDNEAGWPASGPSV